jgi:hypothetical protein
MRLTTRALTGMTSLRRRPLSAVFIERVLLATVLLTPVAAQAQLGGLRKKLEQKITEAVVPKKAESLPPSFSDARYEITAARFDGLLRGVTLADEAQARYERDLPEFERKKLQADRENAELERSTKSMASRFAPSGNLGPMACQGEVMTLLETLPEKDPRRVKGEALMDRLEKLTEETERRERTGQRVDTVGTAMRSMALLDSVAITVRGAPCKVTKADVAEAQRKDEAREAEMKKVEAQAAQVAKTQQELAALNTSAPNRSEIIAREAGLSGVQMGVVCDKLIAFTEASDRKQEIKGFSDAEQALLSKRLPELRKNGKQFCSGFPD